jgi:hypothetical protein
MTEKAWKRTERQIAALLGGQRVPVSGRVRGDCPDIEHDQLSIEVKCRKAIPIWLQEALRQAEASATDGQLPVAILHQNSRRYRDALVVLRISELAKLLDRAEAV